MEILGEQKMLLQSKLKEMIAGSYLISNYIVLIVVTALKIE